MATAVYNEETIKLQDGKEVLLRPLAIGKLRRFMEVWKGFKEVEEGDEETPLSIFVTCAGISIEDSFKEEYDKTFVDGDLTEEYRTYLEDVLDMDTIYKILDVCGGLKLNDPNLTRTAIEKVVAEAAGTN